MHAPAESDEVTLLSTAGGDSTINANYKLYQEVLATPEHPIKIIKQCVYVIIHRIMRKMVQERCNGCEVDHPSQRQHICLYDLPSGFYNTNLEELKKRFYRPMVLNVLMHVCESKGYSTSPLKLMGAVDMFIWELSEHSESEEEVVYVYDLIENTLLDLINETIDASDCLDSYVLELK